MRNGIIGYKVVAKSENTNSFGLYQMVVVARDGRAYKTHASMYYAKEVNEVINEQIRINDEGDIVSRHFIGHEMTSRIADVPSDVLNEIYPS